MSNNIDIVIRDVGTPVVVRNLQLIANNARDANTSIQTLNKSLRSMSQGGIPASVVNSFSALNKQITSLTTQITGLNKSLTQSGSNANSAGNSANRMGGQFQALTGIMALLGTYLSVTQLMDYADAWNSVSGLVAVSTKNMEESATVMERLFNIAQETRAPLQEMGDLYSNVARGALAMGKSQADALGVTRAVGQALAIQHTSANQARGMLIQFGQAISFGKIRAQEYNSMLQNGQVILLAVAKGMYGASGSVAQLGKEVKSGKITSEEFFNALQKGQAFIDEKFKKTVPLFSQGWDVIKNAVAKYVGELDSAYKVSTKFYALARWLIANLPQIGALVTTVGIAIGIAFLPSILIGFSNALTIVIGQLMVAGGLVAALAVGAGLIAGATVAMYLFADSINAGIDKTTSLGDLGRAMWDNLSIAIDEYSKKFNDFWGGSPEVTKDATRNMANHHGKAFDKMGAKEESFFETDLTGWSALALNIAKVLDMAWASIKMFAEIVVSAFEEMFRAMGDQLKTWSNSMVTGFQGVANAVIDFANIITPGGAQASHINLDNLLFKDADLNTKMKSFSDIVIDAQDKVFKEMEGKGLTAFVEKSIADAKLQASFRKKPEADLTDPSGTPLPVSDVVDQKAIRAAEQLAEAYSRVLAEISPMEAAKKRLADAQKVLNDVEAKGWITHNKNVEVMDKLKERYKEALEPLKYMNEALDREEYYLTLTNDQRRIEEDLYQRNQYLQNKGYFMTAAEIEQLKAKLVVEQQLAKISSAREGFRQEGSAQKMTDFMNQLEGFKQAMARPDAVAGDALGGLEKLLPWANFDNTQEQMDAYVEQHRIMYEQIDALVAAHAIKDATATQLRQQADARYNEQRLAGTRSMFSALAVLQSSSNKKVAMIGKAAAITTATIDGYVAIGKAQSSAPYPYNIPAIIGATVQAAMNVANIVSTPLPGYRTGGSFTVGGSGGDDSQTVAFRATPGEQVSINTPTQARALENGGGASKQNIDNSVTVVNVDDPKRYTDAMDTSTGRKVILNHMQSDPSAFKRALGMT